MLELFYSLFADNDIPMVGDFPQRLADMLTISLFSAQLLASLIVLLFPLLPALVYSRGRMPFLSLFIGAGALGFCVAMEWFPVWLYMIILLLVVLLFSDRILGRKGEEG